MKAKIISHSTVTLIKITSGLFFMISYNTLHAQNNISITQTIRGKVIDAGVQLPIEGVTVILNTGVSALGSTTLADGTFRLDNIPVGRHSLQISAIGFKEITLNSIAVNSGKEVVLVIEMEKSITSLAEITVKSQTDKSGTVNKMTDIGARLISVDETQRFAASFNDPLRAVQSFAGITSAGEDGENLISIRGNSPFGIQWRLEGVEIPNPNHFASIASSGGGISIISQQLMGNSDFYTAAFPAEFGNATSGIFDMKLRKGNNEKREHTFQLGILGADISTEGPINILKGSSYLVNYRYSTLGLLKGIGIDLGENDTKFQDLSFNISLPSDKVGNFTFFGLGGISDNSSLPTGIRRFGTIGIDNKGVIGITHTKQLKNNGFVKTIIAGYGVKNETIDELVENSGNIINLNDQNYNQTGLTVSSTLNKRFSARWQLRAGIVANNVSYNLKNEERHPELFLSEKTLDANGTTNSLQAFAQVKHFFSEKLSMMAGVHSQYFVLNSKKSFEPRASLKWQTDKKNSIALGYGHHTQQLPIGIYLSEYKDASGNFIQPNKNLDFYTSDHLDLSYDRMFSPLLRLKAELYYQQLSKIPVNNTEDNTFSLINLSDFFYTEPLVSQGKGKNMGIELTLEHYLHHNFYFLATTSIFNATYSTIQNQWFNTKFNRNYSFSFTGGKDFLFTGKRKQQILGINARIFYSGGLRDTPVDIPATNSAGGRVIYDYTKKNKDQLLPYLRPDIKISFKTNYKNFTGTFMLEVEDVIDRQNIYKRSYSPVSQTYTFNYATTLIPIIGYKIEF
ncbi:MAG: TonB-dependent receptor [Saprospiraceae bacterium]